MKRAETLNRASRSKHERTRALSFYSLKFCQSCSSCLRSAAEVGIESSSGKSRLPHDEIWLALEAGFQSGTQYGVARCVADSEIILQREG